jgi:polyhydroxybutyrate depolymerase
LTISAIAGACGDIRDTRIMGAHRLELLGCSPVNVLSSFAASGVILIWMLVSSPLAAEDIEGKIHVGGLDRTYRIHLPPSTKNGHEMPLVVVLHGGGGNGLIAARQTHFSEYADREHFVVAYPNGTDQFRPLLNFFGAPGFLTWNAGACCGYAMKQGIDDVAFLRAVVADIQHKYPIDLQRVYATGISNGGMMAYRLACEASDIFAAVGVVSGVLVTHPCEPHAAVSVIDFHGTADEYVPILGGTGRKSFTRIEFPPVRESISFWVDADGCQSRSQEARPAEDTLSHDYRECRSGSEVTYFVIEGGGHAWPGGDRISTILDVPAGSISATTEIWRFFSTHPKLLL